VDLQYGKARFFNSFSRQGKLPGGALRTTRPAVKFDSRHVLATAALPPGAAPISIDGGDYWDAGLQVSTPLDEVISELVAGRFKTDNVLVVIVDLWGQTGTRPRNLLETSQRKTEIEYRGLVDASVMRFGTSVLIHQLGAKYREARERIVELEEQLATPPPPPDPPVGRSLFREDLPDAVLATLGGELLHEEPVFDPSLFWGQVDLRRLSMLHVEVGRAPYLPGMSALDFSPSALSERRGHGYADMRAALESSEWTTDLLERHGGMLHRYKAGQFTNKMYWFSSLGVDWTLGTL